MFKDKTGIIVLCPIISGKQGEKGATFEPATLIFWLFLGFLLLVPFAGGGSKTQNVVSSDEVHHAIIDDPKLMKNKSSIVLLLVAITGVCTSIVFFTSIFLLCDYLPSNELPADSSFVLPSNLAAFQSEGRSRHTLDVKGKSGTDYFEAKLCGGCYHAVADQEKNIRCGYLIYNLVKAEGLSLLEAALKIASSSEYSQSCFRCNPKNCSDKEKIFWRYDASHFIPDILSSTITELRSIPASKRVPPHGMGNLTAFFSVPKHSAPNAEYFFHYNPTIAVLPPSFDTRQFMPKDGRPVYVASYRVSTQQSCFHPYESVAMYGGSWGAKPPIQDYLGLALLRSDLSVIQDVVVDLRASHVFQSFAEDFRLFVFHQQVYIASFDYIAPIWIIPQKDSAEPSIPENTVLLKNVFPSTLRVAIRKFPSCPVCYSNRSKNKRCGKNLNYFTTNGYAHNGKDNTATPDVVLVELWPSGPRVTQQMNLTEPCSIARKREEASNALQTFVSENNNFVPAWHTMEEIMFPSMGPTETLLTRGRGGACCIGMRDPQSNKNFLVGIYHTKIPKFPKRSGGMRLPPLILPNGKVTSVSANQYLSRWYAFEPVPPYRLVAESGLFCLGYPNPSEYDSLPLVKTTLWKTMLFGNEADIENSIRLKCPRIHFVSGLTEKANDPSKVIVAYGINDCFPRLIEIDKNDIIQRLIPSSYSLI